MSIKAIEYHAVAPGQVSGPGLRLVIQINNGTAKSIGLGNAVVTIADARGTPGVDMNITPQASDDGAATLAPATSRTPCGGSSPRVTRRAVRTSSRSRPVIVIRSLSTSATPAAGPPCYSRETRHEKACSITDRRSRSSHERVGRADRVRRGPCRCRHAIGAAAHRAANGAGRHGGRVADRADRRRRMVAGGRRQHRLCRRQFRERPPGGRRAGHEPDAAQQPAVLRPNHGQPEHLLRTVAQRPGEGRHSLTGRLTHLCGRQLHHRRRPAARPHRRIQHGHRSADIELRAEPRCDGQRDHGHQHDRVRRR